MTFRDQLQTVETIMVRLHLLSSDNDKSHKHYALQTNINPMKTNDSAQLPLLEHDKV